MTRAEVFVSGVAVLRSYARFLPAFVEEVHRILEAHYTNFELVLVELVRHCVARLDGAHDGGAGRARFRNRS